MPREPADQPNASPNQVKKTVTVPVTREKAFKAFTERMTNWWPLETLKIGQAPAKEAIVERKAGGRWFERGVDDSECQWGRVVEWEPPSRVVLSWEVSSDWKPDTSVPTEIEVRFVSEGANSTLVEFEHRNLDRYGDKRDMMRSIFESEQGWGGILKRFAQAASSG